MIIKNSLTSDQNIVPNCAIVPNIDRQPQSHIQRKLRDVYIKFAREASVLKFAFLVGAQRHIAHRLPSSATALEPSKCPARPLCAAAARPTCRWTTETPCTRPSSCTATTKVRVSFLRSRARCRKERKPSPSLPDAPRLPGSRLTCRPRCPCCCRDPAELGGVRGLPGLCRARMQSARLAGGACSTPRQAAPLAAHTSRNLDQAGCCTRCCSPPRTTPCTEDTESKGQQ